MNPTNPDKTSIQAIYPVILPVPDDERFLKPREKVACLSRHARRAVKLSADKTGVTLNLLPKDADGVPLPVKGMHWSLSHKHEFVGGVVSPAAVGIDIEKIKPCSEALFKRIARGDEWALADVKSPDIFFRYWTAKEAVLKATGDGFKGISRCRISRSVDASHLTVSYANREWCIEHLFFSGHVAAIVKEELEIHWTVDRGIGGC